MHKLRVLIVDDSSVMRKIVERSLREAGIDIEQVFPAGNGEEALGVLHQGKVDLVLCDINMPVMDGLEFVKSGHPCRLVGCDQRLLHGLVADLFVI